MQQNPQNFLTNLTDQQDLSKLCSSFEKDFGLKPCIGVEIEFYLENDDIADAPFVIKSEKGLHQYEIDLPPMTDMPLLIQEIENAKLALALWRTSINFHPKPFSNDYGSAMHFHVNLLRADGSNYFDDDNNNIQTAASSLCHFMRQTFLIFAPEESHYARYDGRFMAPSHIAYGGNNRSVAIRVPDAKPCRLEHRIASPLTNPRDGIFVILKSIYLGLANPSSIKHYPKIYGNAFDEQYQAELLPRSLEEAMASWDRGFIG
jgi:glutamine synthetase